MRWEQSRKSDNIEDRRGRSLGRTASLGGGLTIVALLISLATGQDPRALLSLFQAVQQAVPQSQQAPIGKGLQDGRPDDELAQLSAAVLGETEDVWTTVFASEHKGAYQAPTLVLFSDLVESACGRASSAMGPFYCPPDRKVYLDLSFFQDLKSRFQAGGDFAQAYVIAHEVGHHIQQLLGISERVTRDQKRGDEVRANQLSVRLELQADCLAGVWGHHADAQRHILESGDVEEALNAATAIGDDRLQRQSQGTVVPESFTHGTSEQRVRWFKRGMDSGSMGACDTFQAASL